MTQTTSPDTRPDAGPRRRWVRRLGLLLIVAGLAVLGYVGWQFWGTTWLSHKTQERIVTDVQKDWDKDPAATGEPGSADGAVEVPEGDVGALIRIPRFGDDYVVPVLEGTTDDVLSAGYGHFADSAEPGRVGQLRDRRAPDHPRRAAARDARPRGRRRGGRRDPRRDVHL